MSDIPTHRFHHAMASKTPPAPVIEISPTQLPNVQPAPAPAPAPAPPVTQQEPQLPHEQFTVTLDNSIFSLTPPEDLGSSPTPPAPVTENVSSPSPVKLPEVEAMEKELAELRAFKKKQELEQQLNISNMSFDTMDTAAVREIQEKVLQPAIDYNTAKYNEHLTRLEQELEQERIARKRFEEQNNLQQQANTYRRINNEIQAVHPDVQAIINSEGFTRYLNSTVGSSTITLGSLLVPEYQKGNAKFVIDVLNSYKQQQPMLSNFASVSPNPVATTSGGNSQPSAAVQQSISELNRAMFTGEISRQQFQEKTKQLRELEQHNKGKR